MSVGRLTAAVVVVTYCRPAELDSCLSALGRSLRAPDQLVVVDASPDAESRREDVLARHRALFSAPGSAYVATDRPSCAGQRNTALALVRTDLVMFIDDDTVVHPNYVEKVADVFESDPERRIGGVEGSDPKRVDPATKLRRMVAPAGRLVARRLYVPARDRHRVPLPEGVKHLPLERRRSLHGAKMSFRSALVGSLRFDPHMASYSYCEDFDLSYRVSRSHALVARRDALATHVRARTARVAGIEMFFLSWINPAYLSNKLFPGARADRPLKRLLRLSEWWAAVSPASLRHPARRRELLERHRVARRMIEVLREAPSPELGWCYEELQTLALTRAETLRDEATFLAWSQARGPFQKGRSAQTGAQV